MTTYTVRDISQLYNSVDGCFLPELTLFRMSKNGRIKRKNTQFMKQKIQKTAENFRQKNTDIIKKKVHGLLNKLTKLNYEAIAVSIGEFMTDDDITKFMIDHLFNKAIENAIFSDAYALLFKQFTNRAGYKKILDEVLSKKVKILEQSIINEKLGMDTDNYSDFCDFIKNKGNYINIYTFITNLYILRVISQKSVMAYCLTLMKSIKTCKDLETKDLYIKSLKSVLLTANAKKIFRKFRKDIITIIAQSNEQRKIRSKFALMDILERFDSK